jgi:hypothetical protein
MSSFNLMMTLDEARSYLLSWNIAPAEFADADSLATLRAKLEVTEPITGVAKEALDALEQHFRDAENVVPFPHEVHARTERYHNDLGANHPRIIQMLREAEADNIKLKGVTRTALFVHLRHAERLWLLLNDREFQVAGDRFVKLAFAITRYGKSKSYKLAKLHDYRDAVLRWVDSEAEAALSKGVPFQYPTWVRCLSKFEPKPEKDDDDEQPDEEPDDYDEGLAGDTPDPTPDNLQATIDLQAELLANAQQRRSELEPSSLRPVTPRSKQ